MKQPWYNVVSTLKQCWPEVEILCSVVSTLFQRQVLTLYQRCATLKTRRPSLFHFQNRTNVISTLIHNVETTLIRRRNGGWDYVNNWQKVCRGVSDFPYTDKMIYYTWILLHFTACPPHFFVINFLIISRCKY